MYPYYVTTPPHTRGRFLRFWLAFRRELELLTLSIRDQVLHREEWGLINLCVHHHLTLHPTIQLIHLVQYIDRIISACLLPRIPSPQLLIMSSAAHGKVRTKKEHVPLYDESQVQIHPEATVCEDIVFKGKVTIGRGESWYSAGIQFGRD